MLLIKTQATETPVANNLFAAKEGVDNQFYVRVVFIH